MINNSFEINIDRSKELYNILKNTIKPNSCYNNAFEVAKHIMWEEEKEDFKIVYGYMDNLNVGMFVRHCVIVHKGFIIDVSPLALGQDLNETYSFISFEELSLDEFLKIAEKNDFNVDNENSEKELDVYMNNFYMMRKNISLMDYDYSKYIFPKLKKKYPRGMSDIYDILKSSELK